MSDIHSSVLSLSRSTQSLAKTDRQALFSRSPILSTLKVGLSKIATARLLFSMQHGNCCIAVKDPVFSISVTKK